MKAPTKPIHTKRQLASYVCSLWNPLGYMCPFIISWKIILQKAWMNKLLWDDPLPNDIIQQINILSNHKIKPIKINRSLLSNEMHFQLFGYCDASSKHMQHQYIYMYMKPQIS